MSEDQPVNLNQRRAGLRTGYTTGACAAACARAAVRLLCRGAYDRTTDDSIEIMLPCQQQAVFKLYSQKLHSDWARASIIKDAGDDPDCTHGAEIVAKVRWSAQPGIELLGGEGVARVTLPGLGLEVGGPAINPVPSQNIRDMVSAELARWPQQHAGISIEISVPTGAQLAEQTINARLGLLGGISILGTSGIVKPFSNSAYIASVRQAVEVAARQGQPQLVMTTGRRTERYGMKLLPKYGETAFIQVGDFLSVGLKSAVKQRIKEVHFVAMIGKLSKVAAGNMMTHVSGPAVDFQLLAALALRAGADSELAAAIRHANSARHVFELVQAAHLPDFFQQLCNTACQELDDYCSQRLSLGCTLIDFSGRLLARSRIDRNQNV